VKIYTRRGDGGETDLIGGGRVVKDAPRVEAYGAVDELNSSLGAAVATSSQTDLAELVASIQTTLLAVGSFLATPAAGSGIKAATREVEEPEIAELERAIDRLEAELEPLRRFLVPGGTPAAAAFHVARSACRKAERRVVSLDASEPLGGGVLRYLNRLSDLLFVMARVENRRASVEEVLWEGS
jgi:cob(I)alamin adenosyltransferase